MSSTTVRLQTSDGKITVSPLELVSYSPTIMSMIKNYGHGRVLSLPHITSATLQKILMWAKRWKDFCVPYQPDDCDPTWWESDLFMTSNQRLMELYSAAYYLNILRLQNLLTRTLSRKKNLLS